jgi:hypothetical protein
MEVPTDRNSASAAGEICSASRSSGTCRAALPVLSASLAGHAAPSGGLRRPESSWRWCCWWPAASPSSLSKKPGSGLAVRRGLSRLPAPVPEPRRQPAPRPSVSHVEAPPCAQQRRQGV